MCAAPLGALAVGVRDFQGVNNEKFRIGNENGRYGFGLRFSA